MYGANEPVAVSANVKHHNRISACHPHLIGRTKAPPQIGKMLKLFISHNPPPGFQTCCSLRVPLGKSRQGGFLNYPHAYNLYSSSQFVKTEMKPP
jgi:hypothetical protein